MSLPLLTWRVTEEEWYMIGQEEIIKRVLGSLYKWKDEVFAVPDAEDDPVTIAIDSLDRSWDVIVDHTQTIVLSHLHIIVLIQVDLSVHM